MNKPMTHPREVLGRFLFILEHTVQAAGQTLSGLFDLLFYFPAIVGVLLVEVLIQSHSWLSKAPQLIAPQLRLVHKDHEGKV